MKILVATDISVIVNGDKIYAKGKYATIFNRYYSTFGSIVLFSRVEITDEVTKDCCEITGIVDSIIKIGSLKNVILNRHTDELSAAIRDCELVVARCPSLAGYKASDCAKRLGKPVFSESMGCAWDAYWNHGISGKLIAPYMFFKMKSVVKNADYALYVTSKFLQKRYPCKNESVAASNVLIEKIDESVLQKRIEKRTDKIITLMTTAAVNVKYKGQQYVMKAIPKLNKLGIYVRYVLVGEGDDAYLRSEAKRLKIEAQVEFKGRLSLDEVFDLLDETDIYIQPSLQEGLPRAMIEAMSRGCICIGARTAGIPELIEDKFVVRRKSVSDIVDVICEYVNLSDDTKNQISKRNFEEAKMYDVEQLDERRKAYYSRVREQITK